MEGCTVITLNASFVVLASGLGGAIAAGFGTLFWQVVKGKDAHIQYAQDVNADLTELNRESVGIAGGALKKVPREHTGRRGS